MKKLIEYLSTVIVSVALILTLLGMTTHLKENQAKASNAIMSQLEPKAVLEMLEIDLANLGLATEQSSIILAEPHRLQYTHINSTDGEVDTITYYCSSAEDFTSTPNPNDFLLFRKENSKSPEIINIGLVSFRFDFLDEQASSIATLSAIRKIRVEFETESAFPVGGKYLRMASQLNIHCM